MREAGAVDITPTTSHSSMFSGVSKDDIALREKIKRQYLDSIEREERAIHAQIQKQPVVPKRQSTDNAAKPKATTKLPGGGAHQSGAAANRQGLQQDYLADLNRQKKRILAVNTADTTKKSTGADLTGLAPTVPAGPTADTAPHAKVSYDIMFEDEPLFREALHRAAGSPKDPTVGFSKENLSTWTVANLEKITGTSLVELRKIAGPKCPTPPSQEKQALTILPVDLTWIIPSQGPRFYAQDKYDMTHADGKLVSFDLDVDVFDCPTKTNSADKLQHLLELMKDRGARVENGYLVLKVSPIHAVTLPAEARVRASIPLHAAYYSFCYPIHLDNQIPIDLVKSMGIDCMDPLVTWLLIGGFLYFSHTYNIVAINALSFEEAETGTLTLGEPSPLPELVESRLTASRRFARVTNEHIESRGFTHFAWIIPSEMIGNHIFTQSGGFAYRQHLESGESSAPKVEAKFYPVIPQPLLSKRVPVEYIEPVHIPELKEALAKGTSDDSIDSKFVADVGSLKFGESSLAALGIEKLLGISQDTMIQYLQEGVEAISREIQAYGGEEDRANLEYILEQRAVEKEVLGNDRTMRFQDRGHTGLSLDDFCAMPAAKIADLKRHEVLALRLYTSSTFRRINTPLRERAKMSPELWLTHPHPLAATTYFIYQSLKKLRAVNMNQKFDSQILWRGMKNVDVNALFLTVGGAELGCMSTSSDLSVVARYAQSGNPLVFKIKIDSPMDMGADISWLSLFPEEREILYPPLTFLQPVRTQPIRDVPNGRLVTVKPSFPS